MSTAAARSPADQAAWQAAIQVFNRGDYFAAGQQFETLAASAVDDSKGLLQAFTQIAAGLHLRFERGGRQAAINLLSQAMIVLEDMRPAAHGIDVGRLYDELVAFTEDLRGSAREFDAGALKYRAQLFLERRRAPKIIVVRP